MEKEAKRLREKLNKAFFVYKSAGFAAILALEDAEKMVEAVKSKPAGAIADEEVTLTNRAIALAKTLQADVETTRAAWEKVTEEMVAWINSTQGDAMKLRA